MLYCVCILCNSLETEKRLILALVPEFEEVLDGIGNSITAEFLLSAEPAVVAIIVPLQSTALTRTIFKVPHYVLIAHNCNRATKVILKLHPYFSFFFFLFLFLFKALSYTPVEVKNADERTEKDISR